MQSGVRFSFFFRSSFFGMMLCFHVVYECHCKFQEHAARFYSNDGNTKGFRWQHTLEKEKTTWPIQFRFFYMVWLGGVFFLCKLVNNWTICLLMVFQLNCSIGLAVKLPDLICMLYFTLPMAFVYLSLFFSISFFFSFGWNNFSACVLGCFFWCVSFFLFFIHTM